MRPKSPLGVALIVLTMAGCTRVVVHKDPRPHDHGFRFYRPKPYLFIGPSSPSTQSQGSQQGNDQQNPGSTGKPNAGGGAALAGGAGAPKPAADGKPSDSAVTLTDNNFIKVSMEIKYLPDYNEEYSVQLRPGIGTGQLSFKLDDGWNLSSVNLQTDQKLPELISSIASLIGAVRGGGGGGGGTTGGLKKMAGGGYGDTWNIVVDTRPDVPLGFYEPIIATDPDGHKFLFGWRYVGFLPFAGCPVQPCVTGESVTCDPHELWGIVATPNSIKFDRLTNIRDHVWPYKYKNVKTPLTATDGEDAPSPDFKPLQTIYSPPNPGSDDAVSYIRRLDKEATPETTPEKFSQLEVKLPGGQEPPWHSTVIPVLFRVKTKQTGVNPATTWYVVYQENGAPFAAYSAADSRAQVKAIVEAIAAAIKRETGM